MSSNSFSLFNVVQQVLDREATDSDTAGSQDSNGLSSRKLTEVFKKAALKLRQQSRLDIQDQVDKLKSNNLLIGEDRKQSIDSEEEDEEVDNPPKNTYVSDTVFHELSDQKILEVASFCLKLSHDVSSLQTERENAVMMEYIRELFAHISKDDFDVMNKEAEELSIKDKALLLRCKIMKANDLLAKDSNGKSDPYCIMSLLNKKHIDLKVVHSHDISQWIEEGIVERSWKTSVQEKTLNPVWNEIFELPIAEPQEQYLVVELWDSDESERLNPGTLRRLLRKKDKEDDFLGRVFYLLQRVPADGEEKTLELKSHSTKHTRGTLTVHISVVGTKKDQSPEEAHLSYKQLLECILIKESKCDDGHISRWHFQLPEQAEQLLTQHASLNRICQLEQAAIRLSVLLNYNKAHAIDLYSLLPVLQFIQKCENEMKAAPIDKPFWIDGLERDLKEVGTFILDILRRHLDIFNNFKKQGDIEMLKGYLLAFHDLYQIQFYRKQLSNNDLDYRDVITKTIQTAVPHWIMVLTATTTPEQRDDEHVMIAFKAFCQHCLNQCKRSYDKVHPVFMEIGVDYFSPFFASFDKLLCSEAESHIEKKSKETALLTYEVYRIIQEVSTYASKVDPEFIKKHRVTLSVPNFHIWFKGCVSDWLAVAQSRAKERLSTAIELDTFVKCVDRASFSSSAVDTHAFFLQVVVLLKDAYMYTLMYLGPRLAGCLIEIISFWKDLQWPDRAQSLGYFINIVQCLVELSQYYTDRFIAKVTNDQYTNAEGQFVVTDRLCITLNNIQHVSSILSNISTELNLPSYYKWLDEDRQEEGPPLSERAQSLIEGVLDSANDDLLNKIDGIIDIVKQQLSPNVLEFIPKMMSAPASLRPDKVIEPMITYITENVGKLGEALLTPLFLSILKYLWVQVLSALQREYDKVPHLSANPLHIRLNYVLLNLSDFFEADGNGLDRRYMESETYMSLRDDLFLAVLTTEDIVKKFCYDLVRQQGHSKREFGVLHMSHIYKAAEKVLSVDIIYAENIPGLDRSGKSDPFVQLYLLPSFAFPEASEKVYKTAVKKQTLNPVFEETLKLPVDPVQLSKDGSILLLAIFDHDTISSNDFAGLCAVACSSTPLEGNEVKVEHLNLFHYEQTSAFKELELRETDPLAQDFLKQMKKFKFEGNKSTPEDSFHRLFSLKIK